MCVQPAALKSRIKNRHVPLTAAFREFSKKKLDKERKPSVRMDLTEKKAEAVKRTAQRAKVKNKDRGIEL